MHVAVALTEERLGWDVELIDVTRIITLKDNSDAALEAACTTLTVVARTRDVLWARHAVASLWVTSGCFRLIT